ncbi:hypothetical protein [Halopelagius fulvigenes]|uniref:DUF7845 domain-containing protein n=1 Tax=Halopelagius fulvigenes TaxID=1198324 RepID=A0ABD5U2H9_9EURY
MSHVAPHFHEVDMFLWFTDNGLSPYWALSNLCIREFDGYRKLTYEIGDEVWVARMNYNAETGIAPRDSDPIQSERAYEFKIHAEGPGEQKADFVFSPRWDGQKKPDGEEMKRPWCGGEGVQIHVQGSNLTYDEYLFILQHTLQAFAEEARTDFSRRYFNRPLGDSNIATTELYVRLVREYAKKLTRSTGVFYKIMHLLSEEKDAQWVYKGDNTDIVGKRHAFALDPLASSKLVENHSLGKRLKCYHPKYVRSKESRDDPLSSPKFAVAFHKSLNTTEGIAGEYRSGGSAVKWRDRDQLLREVEETLINVLRGEVVVNDNGLVRFSSEKVRQEITAIVERVESFVEEGVNAVARLANVETRSAADSAIQRWMNKYGASFEEIDEDGGKIRFDTVMSTLASSKVPTLEDVLQEGFDAWCNAGRDPAVFTCLSYVVKNLDGTANVGGSVGKKITW